MEEAEARSEPLVEVPPRRPWRETAVIGLLIANLALIVVMRADALRDRPRSGLGPCEVTVSALPDSVQSVVRALEASAGDIVGPVRDGADWPDVEALAANFVPPFDPRLSPPELRSLRFGVADRAVAWIDYVGGPTDGAGLGGYVLRIVDRDAEVDPFRHPHPHEPRRSEEDARFEVQVWHHEHPAAPYPGVDLRPIGWRRVITDGGAE